MGCPAQGPLKLIFVHVANYWLKVSFLIMDFQLFQINCYKDYHFSTELFAIVCNCQQSTDNIYGSVSGLVFYSVF